ncbi:NAD(P)-dependent oxidoreductase [Pararhodobacter oceanensis]|uniref:NAD(P)-dependent oxidoreductase n=1 Tax=Pararhodobacter oceanensis TaxID=2172121 RepID=UPI003A92D41D
MNKQLVLAPQPTLKRIADIDGPDFYPTPSWATHALIDNEKFDGDIWECACGDGAMSRVLETTGSTVKSTDLYDRGYGVSGVDFRTANATSVNIITNPPFNASEEFVHSALRNTEKKFAFLLRLAFLEGIGRQKTIFNVSPPSRVWVFSERITFYPKNAERKGSGTTAYAWFVWDKNASGSTEVKWLPTGYKSAKYS